VKKTEAGRLMAEVLRSSRAVIDAKLDQWNTALSQQVESRDQTEQVRGEIDTELRQSYDDLRREFQVTTIYTYIMLVFISRYGVYYHWCRTHGTAS